VVGPGGAGAKGRGVRGLKLSPPPVSSKMRTMTRRIVSMVTSQRSIDSARSSLPALVPLALYGLGDLVYGLL
jgi:hypothetical protein